MVTPYLNSKQTPHASANCIPFWPGRIEVQSRLESSSAWDRLHLGFHSLMREPSFHTASIDLLPGGRLLASDRICCLGSVHAAERGFSGDGQVSHVLIDWATQNAGFGTLPFHLDNSQSGIGYTQPINTETDISPGPQVSRKDKYIFLVVKSCAAQLFQECRYWLQSSPPSSRFKVTRSSRHRYAKLPQLVLAHLKYSKPDLGTPGFWVFRCLYQQLHNQCTLVHCKVE